MSSPPHAQREQPRAGDVVLAAVLTAALCGPYLMFGLRTIVVGSMHVMLPLLTTAMMTVAMIWRRSNPTLMLGVVTFAGVVQLLLLRYPTTSVVVIPLAAYSFARWTDGRRSRLILPLGAAASVLGPISWMPGLVGYENPMDAGSTSLVSLAIFYAITVMVCAGLVITPYAIGRRIRESVVSQEQARQAEVQRYQAAINQREAAGRMAEARARAQIARELHDIVAHSLSVMIVQAEGGRAVAAKRPEKAAEVLDTIASTGRDALGEMRRIVGVLRGTDDDNADYAPSPGLGDIPEMVERAGDRISLAVSGPEPVVPETLGLTVYRVAQEAVTNVLKHAGPEASAEVSLTYLPELIVVQVVDDGPGHTSSDGKGHGLRGMHERVASMGGRLVARPRSQGGFMVRALFPMPGHRLPDEHPFPPQSAPPRFNHPAHSIHDNPTPPHPRSNP
ncbi:sensor histidine kinase [Aestuariimicrobium sp. T2.26MG-19.2B]|uniref:sensor histidine kinase n=1 Tax=Aestuariimicrobium sp. T2.26MG-19.2B TaxID=3040679 RepID=UPI002540768C|nr:sensor histidine kinase [Aestuariimicrobium sp. T2.26MG-19.2B]